jgi:NTE family protein
MKQPLGEISDHVRVGLALSGGGARGLAQVGVLKVLERHGIPVHLIAGTSIGAVVGGLYACYQDAEEVERRVLATLSSDRMQGLDLDRILKLSGIAPARQEGEAPVRTGLLTRARRLLRRVAASHAALTSLAVIDGEAVLQMYDRLYEGRTFDQTKIPFAAVAVDLERGCEVIIATGPLSRGVAASSAIAGIFPPVEIEGRRLADGGYTSPVPIDATQTLGANVVIAVDVSHRDLDRGKLENAVEVAMRSSEISLLALEREQLRRADVVVPARGRPRHWSDYSDPMEAIQAGEDAAEGMIDTIRAAIQERARLFI